MIRHIKSACAVLTLACAPALAQSQPPGPVASKNYVDTNLAGKAPLTSPAFSGISSLNGVGRANYGMDYAADGQTQFRWLTAKGGALNLFAYKNGAYVGRPLSLSPDDTNGTGTTMGSVDIMAGLTASVVGAPHGNNAMSSFDARNTGQNGAAGFSNVYRSAAIGTQFDVGRKSLSIFNPTPFSGTVGGKYDHFNWAVSPTDNSSALTTTKLTGTAVAEWNITNMGGDFGFHRFARGSLAQPTGGLLMAAENFNPETGIRAGLNASYAYTLSRTGQSGTRMTPQAYFTGSVSGTTLTVSSLQSIADSPVGELLVGQTVQVNGVDVAKITASSGSGVGTYTLDTSLTYASGTSFVSGIYTPGKFYSGYVVEPDAIAGRTGRGAYLTGSTSADPKLTPYAPLQVDGSWLHGIDTTLSNFSDGSALRLKADQKIVWLNTNGTVAGTLTAPGAWTAYTPLLMVSGGTNASAVVNDARYELVEKTLRVRAQITTSGTSPSSITIGLPPGMISGGTQVGTLHNIGTDGVGVVAFAKGSTSGRLAPEGLYASGSFLGISFTIEIQ